MRIVLPSEKTYIPGPGICIYCRRENVDVLTREHIVPRAIAGRLVLHRASCSDCANIINKQIESPFLQHHILPLRAKLGLKRPPPSSLRIIGRWNQQKYEKDDFFGADFRWETISTDDSPLVITLPIFSSPGIFRRIEPREDFEIVALQSKMQGNFPTSTADGENVGIFQQFSPDIFCRQIAKIAHGAAIAELGFGQFEPMLVDIILGFNKNISHLIGSAFSRGRSKNCSHNIVLTLYGGYLIALIQLFSDFGFRPYVAVVGKPYDALARWHMSLRCSQGARVRLNRSLGAQSTTLTRNPAS